VGFYSIAPLGVHNTGSMVSHSPWMRKAQANVPTLAQQCVSEGRKSGSARLEANALCGLSLRDLIWSFPS
jgi:hypothetical protein